MYSNPLQTLLDQFPIAVNSFAPDGNVLYANKAWEQMFSEDFNKVKGKYNLFKDPIMSELGLIEVIKKAFEGKTVETSPFLYDPSKIGYNGRKRWAALTLFPLKDDSDILQEVVMVIKDVTYLKEAEEEILKLNKGLEERVQLRTSQLEATNKQLEAFAYTVSHDLQTPIKAVNALSNILMESFEHDTKEQNREVIEKIKLSSNRTIELVNGLLDFSRLGERAIHRDSVDIAKIVTQIVSEIKETNKQLDINLRLRELPIVNADSTLLSQVLQNLITNAVKFTDKEQEICIEVGSKIQDEKITYYVKDNGIGFDEKFAKKIFTVFNRLHSVQEYEGMGVGLSVVQSIIEKHGGDIWTESTVGKGSTFFFTLQEL